MAADVENFENDDTWLYGDNTDGPAPGTQDNVEPFPQPEPIVNSSEAAQPEPPGEQFLDEGPPGVEHNEHFNNENEAEDGELQQNGEESDKDLDDDSDDDVNVVIGDIKTSTSTSYAPLIKRGGLTTTIGDKNKSIPQIGSKFNVEEFEQIGTINGVPSTDFNLDALEEKPWRKPGADITDYFNYGFNEDTWKAYCERQKRIRINESGVGIVPLNAIGLPSRPMILMNDNSKYNNNFMGGMNQRPMMPPPPKPHEPPKMNTIQVMTADRREYSRKPNAFPDMTVPPPAAAFEEYQPEFGFNPEPEPFFGYEPTQDSQWCEGGNPNWTPTDIKTLTGAPPMGPPPPQVMGPPPASGGGPPSVTSPGRRSPSRERERDRDRDRDRESRSRSEKPRDHEREKSRRRERSRSRSRRHRSRSRSPGHRSHKKKKSRRHEDSD